MNMKKIIAIAAAASVAVVAVCALCKTGGRSISVSGECFMKIPRDKLRVAVKIRSLDKNAAASLRYAQAAADEVVGRIKKISDASMEIQTKRISSFEETTWNNNTRVVLGIRSEIVVEITTDSKETLTAVLNSMDGAKNAEVLPQGMSNFSSPAVVAAATEECLKAATQNARAKAAAIAKADGRKVGRLVHARLGGLANDDYETDGFMFRAAKAPMMASESSGDYIQSSDGDLSLSVGAVFRIR
ncbi:MAG: SIMPL domain-containing protein [Rickettsiales bacterium]|jgi:uncharacterized protein YggE|nr:SIMPL domain-containing protein [Rickettsiales bacterium]